MSKLVIGLTGGIGSGKTTIADHFQKLGVEIIDADIIAREVVAPSSSALSAIATHFGSQFIQTDGQLNRALLRSRIFSNEADKLWLNNLLHPLIRHNIISQTEQAKSSYCILVAPLLLENKLNELVNRVLVVDVSEEKQIARTLLRDNSSTKEIKSIMASQVSRVERLKEANDIFNNDLMSVIDIEKHVLLLHKKYLTLTIKV